MATNPERILQPAKVEIQNDSVRSPHFDDIYFSTAGGLEETEHVFLKGNGLPERWEQLQAGESFRIGELGFGTGLNFLVTWRKFLETAPPEGRLEFYSCEAYPLELPVLKAALDNLSGLEKETEALLNTYPPLIPGFHRLVFEGGRVVLNLLFGEALRSYQNLFGQSKIQAWFLDGFAPSKNPEMWSLELFQELARLTEPGGSMATFSVAGLVRRNLKEAGFAWEKTPGFGRKKEMLQARLEEPSPAQPRPPALSPGEKAAPWFIAPDPGLPATDPQVLVIGGGMAGTSVAEALTRRGRPVLLLEEASEIARGASGNPRGIALPLLSAEPTTFSRMTLKAFYYLKQRIAEMTARGLDPDWLESGVVQLAWRENMRAKYQRAVTEQALPPETARYCEAPELSEICGESVNLPGVHFPGGGALSPRKFCQANLELNPGVELRTHRGVARIERKDELWRALDAEGNLLGAAPNLVLACSASTSKFEQTAWLPLETFRGQLFTLPAGLNLKTVLCYDGYVIPQYQGQHIVGATFEDSRETEILPEQNLELYEKLKAALPELQKPEWTPEFLKKREARVAFRTTGKDHLPLMGPVPDYQAYAQTYGDIAGMAHAKRKDYASHYPPGPVLPGLYTLTGLGSRGLLYAPLGAEHIASLINGEHSPLEWDLAAGLHPARFLVRPLLKAESLPAPPSQPA